MGILIFLRLQVCVRSLWLLGVGFMVRYLFAGFVSLVCWFFVRWLFRLSMILLDLSYVSGLVRLLIVLFI